MDENKTQKQDKKAAVKWCVLIALCFVVAACSIDSDFVLVCILAIAIAILRLQKLGFRLTDQQHFQGHIKSYTTPDATPGIAGKTYTIGTHTRWPYY